MPLAPPSVPPLLQGRVVQLTGECQLGLKGEALIGGWIEAIAVGSPKNEEPTLHGTMIGMGFDSCLSKRRVRYVIAVTTG